MNKTALQYIAEARARMNLDEARRGGIKNITGGRYDGDPDISDEDFSSVKSKLMNVNDPDEWGNVFYSFTYKDKSNVKHMFSSEMKLAMTKLIRDNVDTFMYHVFETAKEANVKIPDYFLKQIQKAIDAKRDSMNRIPHHYMHNIEKKLKSYR